MATQRTAFLEAQTSHASYEFVKAAEVVLQPLSLVLLSGTPTLLRYSNPSQVLQPLSGTTTPFQILQPLSGNPSQVQSLSSTSTPLRYSNPSLVLQPISGTPTQPQVPQRLSGAPTPLRYFKPHLRYSHNPRSRLLRLKRRTHFTTRRLRTKMSPYPRQRWHMPR